MRLLALLLIVGCAPVEAPPPAAPTPSNESVLANGRFALAQEGIRELAFGVTPFVDPARLREEWTPVLAVVSERLDVPIRLVIGESYEDMERQAEEGTVDLLDMTPYSYVRAAANQPGLRVFATHIADGSPTYASYVIALEDGPVRELADLPGRRFAFVSRSSTSGFLFPAHRMLEEGIHPLNDLDEVFLGSHDPVFDAVVSGEVDAGAIYAGGMIAGRLRHPDGPAVRVIGKARRIPLDAYVARAGLPKEISDAFVVALSEISTRTEAGRQILSAGLQINGFLPVTDDHYDVVREVDAAVRDAL